MDHLQFYPTPPALAVKAWQKFTNKEFQRVLDPSAGNGDLLAAFPSFINRHRKFCADAIEINPARHAALKGHGFSIVGLDFDAFETGSIYSHIIMNPPFAKGCDHVLRAWNILYQGEIVAIINAETLRNPFSRERQLLAKLVAEHGSVEFISGAFKGHEVERETDVDVALIHLRKDAEPSEFVEDLVSALRTDEVAHGIGADFKEEQQLALPSSFVENVVIAFKAAVEAMKRSVRAEAQASYYTGLLGATLAERSLTDLRTNPKGAHLTTWVRATMAERYDELKDRAWAHVLRSTEVTAKLSTKAQQRLESEFQSIKQLEFTASNIYGFLQGLSQSGWEITIGMACDVFDHITRYHSDNAAFYMGWKSNDRHRTCGMRIKMTRFIIPGHPCESYQSQLRWESERMLSDFDKVFAMLDGKQQPEVSLVHIFKAHFNDLRTGDRISSSYFDVRYYPGIGTIHFFPRNKELVDRLNRMVGKHRQWLPPRTEDETDGFWKQFEKAEKLDPALRKAFGALNRGRARWDSPQLEDLTRENDKEQFSPETFEAARQNFVSAASQVLEAHGIDIGEALSHAPSSTLAIAMAA